MIFIAPYIPPARVAQPEAPKSRLPEANPDALPAVLPAESVPPANPEIVNRCVSPHRRRESYQATAHMLEEEKAALELLPANGDWVCAFDVFRAVIAKFPANRGLVWRMFTSLVLQKKMRRRKLDGVLYLACSAQPHLDPAISSRPSTNP